MQRKAGRLKAMLVVFLSISFALLICVLFYFYQIQENEKYQNQLHFRELNNITVSLDNGVSAFSSYVEQRAKSLSAPPSKISVNTNLESLYAGMVLYKNNPDPNLARYLDNHKLLKNKVNGYKKIQNEVAQIEDKEENSERIKMWQDALDKQRIRMFDHAALMHKQDLEILAQYVEERSLNADYSPKDDGVLTRANFMISASKECINRKKQSAGDFDNCFVISYETAIVIVYYYLYLSTMDAITSGDNNWTMDAITTGDNKSSPLRNLQRSLGPRKYGYAQYQIEVDSSVAEVVKGDSIDKRPPSPSPSKSQTNLDVETWTVPIEDWLGGSKTLYPLVLLVNTDGETIARKQNARVNSSLIGIEFSKLNDILDEVGRPENDKALVKAGFTSTSKEVSKFIDVQIAGNEYRLFVSPFINQKLLDASGQSGTFYVVGLREKRAFDSTKLSISRSQITGFVLFTLVLIAFIPLLKIRLSSVSQAFSAWDRHSLAVGSILLITVITIGVYDYLKYNQVKQTQDALSQSIFMQMRNAFALELEVLLNIVEANIPKDQSGAQTSRTVLDTNDTKFFRDELLENDTNTPFFLENMFVLNGALSLEESVKLDGLAKWSTANRFRGFNREISLAKRDYAVRGVKNDLWPVDFTQTISNCEPGLFIERLFNLRDGAKSAQLVMSCGTKNAFGFYDALSFGTQIQTLTNTVLPPNFGFVVFENATGRALYHSDDANRSLVENLLVETGNNALFNSLLNSPFKLDQPTLLDIEYSGKDHRFAVGELKKGIPWTLVIFYDKEETRAINLMAVLVSLSICIITFLFLYFLSVMLIPKSMRRHLFWPTPVDNTLHTRLLMVGVLVGASTLFGGVSLLIATQVFKHHDERLAQIHLATLSADVATRIADVNGYRNAVLDSDSVNVKKAKVDEGKPQNEALVQADASVPYEDKNIKSSVLCYLGKGALQDIHAEKRNGSVNGNRVENENSDHNIQLCEATATEKSLSKHFSAKSHSSANVIEYFWKYSVLDGEIDESLNVISYLTNIHKASQDGLRDENTDLNKYIMRSDNEQTLLFAAANNGGSLANASLRFALGLIIVFVLCLMFYTVAKEWIFNRFFGFNIPPFFRLRSTVRYDVIQALEDHFFASKRYMMVVRAKLKTRLDIEEKELKPNNPFYESLQQAPLISNKIFHIPSCYVHGVDAAGMLRKFLKIAAEQYPHHQRYTIAIEGLEEAAYDEDLRNFSLQLMERLIATDVFRIVLFCEQAPLFRLTQREQFPTRQGEAAPATASEMVRWSHALQPFIKVYDWSPRLKARLHDEADATAVLVHESHGWPQLRSVLKQFLLFSQSTAQGDEEAFEELLLDVKEQEKADTVVLNLDESKLTRAHIDEHWLPAQIIEFFSANCSALYRAKWEQCTVTERTILYQIASGLEPNPLNRAPLEHLVRRGYICRDRGWFVVNLSFKQFVMTAESPATFDNWLTLANESVWQYLRIPFFAILIVLLAIMAYTATDAIETALGVLTAVFGLIPLALRNFSMIKGGQ